MSTLINATIQTFKAKIEELVKDLHGLAIRIGHEELAKTVSDLRNRIHEPFMFVIVGEVKAGKSSFINALLATGREITRVAPQPMTDTIQQILYGEEEETIVVNPHLKKILLPVEILREIAIVDTPGTNTIIAHHQEITESFIPASDLIVFVFEAKNPYRQSAWEFFDFIHTDWLKKVIFVLQQKDLMPEEDLAVNLNGVRDYARKKGIPEPIIFAVSAKAEQEGDLEASGFGSLRDYIHQNITGGQAPYLKLVNNLSTSRNIGDRIAKGLADRKLQWEADTAFREDIHQTLIEHETRAFKQVNLLVENLLAGYDRITRQKGQELSEGLSFFSLLRRSFTAIFSRSTSVKEWLNDLATSLEQELNNELRQKLTGSVEDLADSIQQMAKVVDLKIRNSRTILRDDHDLFSDIAEKRINVLRELQDAFAQFISQTENFADAKLFPDKSSISPNIATGSGLAVVGLILSAVTQGAVFDVTGGVLTAIGLIFAGATASIKRRKIIGGYETEVAKGRNRIESDVTDKLRTYISHLKHKIEANFWRFDSLLEQEAVAIAGIEQDYTALAERITQLEKELSKLG
ncbi:MAG: dynamin family protein [Saprospiraceae bacterium]|nr:dynamin family protein [Saprospiraceae bacterium]